MNNKPVTAEESIAEQKKAHPYFKPELTHEISMIVPGRRALGESWTKVTIGHDADRIVYQTEAAEAPADGRSIVAVSGEDAEMASYILTAQMEKARSRAVAPQALTRQERFDLVNAAWHDYVEQKLRMMRGVSTFGAGGAVQRQRVAQNPATRPAMHKE